MRAIQSPAFASRPISTRRLFRRTPARIVRAASSAVVMKNFSNVSRPCCSLATMKPTMFFETRLACAMFVRIPPGCTHVADTPHFIMSSSWRNDSVKPRTANFVAL
ncbi:hypothetical protein BamIOP4010DRAFT_6648 [Burkholderia ambifaria IOP40-10]|uniref:Uncharacterized protein n=1 Tax=Burkholderia ambifaria IOP40-10 TaxID=396596 RepID=B1FRI7_9BURK|nr:hypothetical protein BamIOP4010DRAFT_6648 [Burkholderia ambifaria IOP40-10]